jgi:Arc/MetJ-type ribon-helix-helix transcriptional regulator
MGSGATTKVTYSLPADLVEEVRCVVGEGAAPSYSAFVEEALRDALRQARDRLLAAEFEAAANDAQFVRDLSEAEADFHHADAETSRLIP